jgi:Na+/H+ antiporter NhaD/arsenite permease-like protein
MEILAVFIFILGYLGIAFEHPLKIDKSAFALITGVLCWVVYVYTGSSAEHSELVHQGLSHHLTEISEILFFLIGAMTIVELVDAHEGFKIITDRITTTNTRKLLWIISILSFFMSAALDNLTTSIVMISLLRKLIKDQKQRWFFAGMVIIACNAGGAWSPIGDVTTTMLWIKGQIPSTSILVSQLFLPSFFSLIVPLLVLSFTLKGEVEKPTILKEQHETIPTTPFERNMVFILGLCALLFVPVFKVLTHLPPFMGMMFGLGVLWIVSELLHKEKTYEEKSNLSVVTVLRKIDMSSVLFFLGILLAVGALQELGFLRQMAQLLDDKLGNIYAINISIGLLSALVDNVPLVAAAQGMYDISSNPLSPFAPDGDFWLFLAYCAGTGGSSLIIGSAAGVAVMGLEKISFGWYLKTITPWALLGYFAGAILYILMNG